MTGSYDEMMGSPSDPADHPATSMPQATQHYAGDVLPMPGERSMGSSSSIAGVDPNAVPYSTGQKKDPKVLSIGEGTLRGWANRTDQRLK